ncbi:Nitrogen fixation regulation protein FixK [Ensifer adhaerens]|uniref:CRP/FNR family transcriptional regulator n=1 Tax=Ensifer adhaerens TaxID=106592 RepID=A0ACC5T5Q6_ENSAD|nr:helix-turn-helix domain-containing protein [Ensifer adhaerens]MBP1876441.1 CRP/FNR family transcriptional regulator [Ensifer adhaerens]NRP20157.1 Nitrogen fixation regulation protein FixK [Ensifer adhaerens]
MPDTITFAETTLPPPPSAAFATAKPSPNRQRLVGEHATLLFQGGRNRHLYRVVDGCVALSQLLDDGRRQITDVLGPGRLFGFTHDGRNIATAETLTFARIETLAGGQVEDGDHGPDVAAELKATLHRMQAHATLLGRKTATEKVATGLIDLADQFAWRGRAASRNLFSFNLYLSRADLADWLGLTVETVSRCLNRFKRDGLIDFNHPKTVRILDEQQLRALAGLARRD